MLLEHHLDKLCILARKVCWLFQRIAKTGGGFPVFCCILAAKLRSSHRRGCEVQSSPGAAHDSLTSFLFSSRFLNINSWLLLHSESQKNPGSYSEVTVRSGFSPAILFYTERISRHPEKGLTCSFLSSWLTFSPIPHCFAFTNTEYLNLKIWTLQLFLSFQLLLSS